MMAVECDRECEQCGKGFSVKRSTVARGGGKYCSRACLGESQRKQVQRKCEQCGKGFSVKRSKVANGKGKYCSRVCAGLAQNHGGRLLAQCEHCGNAFETWRSKSSKHCGQDCYHAGRVLDRCECECEQCGATFYKLQSRVDRGEGRYCSNECFAEGQRSRVDRTCEQCGEVFEASPSQVELGAAKYCSNACYGEARRKPDRRARAVILRTNSRGWTHKVWEQHGGKRNTRCVLCDARAKTIDHIKPLSLIMEEHGLYDAPKGDLYLIKPKGCPPRYADAAAELFDVANGRPLCVSCNSSKGTDYEPGQAELLAAAE